MLQDGEIILQDEAARNLHERPFPNHVNKGKRQAMMASAPANAPKTVEGDPKLDKMAKKV